MKCPVCQNQYSKNNYITFLTNAALLIHDLCTNYDHGWVGYVGEKCSTNKRVRVGKVGMGK